MLTERVIERLSVYRRILLRITKENTNKTSIYSHELAKIVGNTSAQIRRDIMNLGYSGAPRKGYVIEKLLECISSVLDKETPRYIAVIGVGNLGLALINYFKNKRPKLEIAACFDNDPEKIGKVYSDVKCYSIDKLDLIINDKNIKIGVISLPAKYAQEIVDIMIKSGVTSFVNFSPQKLNVPENVFIEQVDITVSLEKSAYFS